MTTSKSQMKRLKIQRSNQELDDKIMELFEAYAVEHGLSLQKEGNIYADRATKMAWTFALMFYKKGLTHS